MIRTFVFDGDDTLWSCSQYYFNAMKRFSEESAARTGLPVAFCRSMLDAIDGGMLSLPGAFGRDRFPTSFKATSLALDAISNKQPNEQASHEAFAIGDSVFYEDYPVYEGVRRTLLGLKSRGATLIINTKGDREVQLRKIKINHLDDVFNQVSVTLTKDIPYYKQMLSKYDLDPAETVFVGDSMRDDIIAPNSLGAYTIYVSQKPASEWIAKWSYEAKIDGPIDPTWWVKTIPEILTLPMGDLPGDRYGLAGTTDGS